MAEITTIRHQGLGLSWLTPFVAAPTLLLCVGLALPPERAEAAGSTYTATEVASLPEGSTRVVRAMNDNSEIVGTVAFDSGVRGFFLDGAGLQEIAGLPPGSDYSAAFGINGGGIQKLFMTHPPLEERIGALQHNR